MGGARFGGGVSGPQGKPSAGRFRRPQADGPGEAGAPGGPYAGGLQGAAGKIAGGQMPSTDLIRKKGGEFLLNRQKNLKKAEKILRSCGRAGVRAHGAGVRA